MGTRRHVQPVYEGHSTPAGMTSYVWLSAAHDSMDPLPHEIFEKKLASQTAEIDQLVADNHHLASTHLALRQDLAAAHEEIERMKEHIRSIRPEGDIQIRIILDKAAKKELGVQTSDSIKKDLQQCLNEAQELVTTNQELSAKIKHATEELEKARFEVKKLPELRAELEKLQQEHQRLRKTFEYEKGLNLAKVEKMKLLEIELVGKAKELDRLRAELSNAERRALAIDSYGHPSVYSTPPMHSSMIYTDGYGRPHARMGIHPIGEGHISYGAAGTGPIGPGFAPANPAWARGPY